ncbi:MAG: hypothetical protein LBH36_01670 [Candidatus Nomurabacteria bacterium]|jgi:uncharacterized protein YacL|nr:hypothetical protein [Candidatus Nomurabacteria bacterium]
MELYIILALVVVLVETTILVLRSGGPSLVKNGGRRKVFIDTSSIIDGRILPVAETGFIGDELIVPKSVLSELQLLADGADSEKRARARFGLDVVASLQKVQGLKVTILRDEPFVSEGVDNRLIALAKKYGGLIMTNDFNLNKVAVVEGVTVLNINDLAQNLRSEFLPGDKLKLDLVQKGSSTDQAVGYLQDGTMVVVEGAAGQIGNNVEVEFIRHLQTSAGKMMFAKKTGSDMPKSQTRQTGRKPQRQTREKRAEQASPSEKKEQKSVSKQDSRSQRRPRRKETNEDRLVRLANK